MARILLAAILALAPFTARATILIYTCNFEGMSPIVITIYDDGTPARVGVASGVGDKAAVHFDRYSGAVVIVESNIPGIPITMTTINRDGRAVHSRHVINADGWFAPSQTRGTCVRALP